MPYGYSENSYFFEPAEDHLFDGSAFYPVEVNSPLWVDRFQLAPMGVMILNWLRTNIPTDERAMHEPLGAKAVDENNVIVGKHRFYFDSRDSKDAFLEEFKNKSWRFQLFEDVSDIIDDCVLSGAVKYKLSKGTTRADIALYFWCQDNLAGRLYRNGNTIVFTDSQDIVKFKLALMGDDALNVEEFYFKDGQMRKGTL